MVKKYEQLQFSMTKSQPSIGLGQASSNSGLKPTSLGIAHEDFTSRFFRELREKQASAQDTNKIHAADRVKQL